jgi:1-acyl-sn-glycerol-3-phosphate acyltransferase
VGLCTDRIPRFIIWKPIYDIPIAKNIFDVLLAIPIDASSPKPTIRALRTAKEEIEKGTLIALFPEGQITRSGHLEKFERGYERIVADTGVPIIPIHIGGMWGHPLSCKGGALGKSKDKLFRPKVRIRVGRPLPTDATPEELRAAILELGEGEEQ